MLSVERIEGTAALCTGSDGTTRTLPLASLPADVREGDLLTPLPEGGYAINAVQTAQQRGRLHDRLQHLAAESRRRKVLSMLQAAQNEPVSASVLATRCSVTRQVIVNDVAMLRAGGAPIVATPRGYLIESAAVQGDNRNYTIVCSHNTPALLLRELYIVVDHGAQALDVIVEHPVYGQITGQLQVCSRFDADRFAQTLASTEAEPLARLTGGLHLHTLRCPDFSCYERIVEALRSEGIWAGE